MISQETLALLFTIGLGLGTLLSGIVAAFGQKRMKGAISQHIESTSSKVDDLNTKLGQKEQEITEIRLEARYNAGRFDTAIGMVEKLQRDIVELKQHEADLVRLLKQAYAQIASMKAASVAERSRYEGQIAELQRRISELEEERETNRSEISRLNEALARAFVEGLRPTNGKVAPTSKQPTAKPAPKPTAKKPRTKKVPVPV